MSDIDAGRSICSRDILPTADESERNEADRRVCGTSDQCSDGQLTFTRAELARAYESLRTQILQTSTNPTNREAQRTAFNQVCRSTYPAPPPPPPPPFRGYFLNVDLLAAGGGGGVNLINNPHGASFGYFSLGLSLLNVEQRQGFGIDVSRTVYIDDSMSEMTAVTPKYIRILAAGSQEEHSILDQLLFSLSLGIPVGVRDSGELTVGVRAELNGLLRAGRVSTNALGLWVMANATPAGETSSLDIGVGIAVNPIFIFFR